MPNKKSMLEREQYGLGGLGKLLSPVVEKVAKSFGPDDSVKEIKTKLNTIIDKIEAAPLGSSKKETFQKIADEEDIALSLVKDANKINSYRSGGGKSDSLLGEVASTVRAMTKKPTSGQADSEALGGTKTTREARRGKGFAILGTAALTIPTTALSTAWFIRNDKEPTSKEASAFEKAFSKAFNKGEETFMFKNKEYTTDIRKGKALGGDVSEEMSEEDGFRMMYNAFKQDMKDAESPEEQKRIQENFQKQTQNVGQEVKMSVFKEQDRTMKAEGSLLVAPEMGMEEEMPVDTFTPEEQAMAGESQVPDDQMEDDYMGFMLDESLDETEQEYLMGALESDPRLSEIFDKVIMTASEFSGAGEVEGPGTGVSDSIPARLSDGEFVITEEATSEIGADNLQTMMDDAERKASGGMAGFAQGGLLSNPYGMPNQQMEEEEDPIEQSMLGSNQMPSLMGGRR